MDLKVYYDKIRQQRGDISDPFPVVVSNETSDGGKPGTMTEVTRELAAKLVVDGVARLARDVEATEFRQRQADMRAAAQEAQAASKVQVTLIPKELLEQLGKKKG
jgi:hypothetical protein